MTKYLESGSFSVSLGSEKFRENYDAIFGKKEPEQAEAQPAPVAAEPSPPFNRFVIFEEIEAERIRQDAKWGGPQHDDEHTNPKDWGWFIEQQLWEGTNNPEKFRQQLVRVAALAVAAIEVEDRKAARGG